MLLDKKHMVDPPVEADILKIPNKGALGGLFCFFISLVVLLVVGRIGRLKLTLTTLYFNIVISDVNMH